MIKKTKIMSSEMGAQLENFKSLADTRLTNHLMEINTRYRGEAMESDALRTQAFEEHRSIFEREMDEEIAKLAGAANPWLASEMDGIKRAYLSRLSAARDRSGL